MPEDQLTLEQWIAGATSNETVHHLFRNLAAAIFAVNADEIPAKAFLTYFMHKGAFRNFGFHPDGTIGVCQTLADVVTRDGGEIWLSSPVTKLHVDGGRVTAPPSSATAPRRRSPAAPSSPTPGRPRPSRSVAVPPVPVGPPA